MIILFLKFLLIASLIIITYQDYKDRMVWWFLFPVFAITAGYLHFIHAVEIVFILNLAINFLIVMICMSVGFLYARLKLKVSFLREAFGLGDLLFFIGLAGAFPTVSFIIVFAALLLSSLLTHFIIAKSSEMDSVPLAGYASFFLTLTYITNWTGEFLNIYKI